VYNAPEGRLAVLEPMLRATRAKGALSIASGVLSAYQRRRAVALSGHLAPVPAMTINPSVVRRSRVNSSRVRHRPSGFRVRFQTVFGCHLALARLLNRGSTLLQINA
jgi:hypothetical protein